MAHDQSQTTSRGRPFDPMDPHGFHAGESHGHHVVSQRMLLGVLTALLLFTLLTVGASRAEVWIAEAFNVEIPQLVNVLIAMSIAVVKGTLVALFFMQLWYDKALNAIIFCFCLLGLGLFLGFSILDLHTRDSIVRWKDDQLVTGGMGGVTYVVRDPETGEPVVNEQTGEVETRAISGPIAEYARSNPDFVKSRIGAQAYKKLQKKHEEEHGAHIAVPDPNHALPMHGRLLFAEGDHSGESPADDHADPDAPAGGSSSDDDG